MQEAPALPAQTLTDSCYRGMFQSCTALTTAPDLLAETLVDNCYRFMFNGSSHLNYIKMTAKSGITATDCFKNWVSGVSATGTFVKDKDVTNIPVNSVNGIPVGWTVIEYDFDKMNPLLFNITSPGNIVWKTSDSSLAKTIEYSKDNGNT